MRPSDPLPGERVDHLPDFIHDLCEFMVHMLGSFLRQSLQQNNIPNSALLQRIVGKVCLPLVVVLEKKAYNTVLG